MERILRDVALVERMLTARGSELERTFAYGVVRQLFEPVLQGQTTPGWPSCWTAPPAAAILGYADPPAPELTTGDASFASLHGLFWLTANLCARHSQLLVVDDLHWADVPSLRVPGPSAAPLGRPAAAGLDRATTRRADR